MGGCPTKTEKVPELPQHYTDIKVSEKPKPAMSPETNNNVESFVVVETGATTAASTLSPVAKIWLLLTPKVLKVIIVILITAIVATAIIATPIIILRVTAPDDLPLSTTPFSTTSASTTTSVSTLSPSPTISTASSSSTSTTLSSTSTTANLTSPTTTSSTVSSSTSTTANLTSPTTTSSTVSSTTSTAANLTSPTTSTVSSTSTSTTSSTSSATTTTVSSSTSTTTSSAIPVDNSTATPVSSSTTVSTTSSSTSSSTSTVSSTTSRNTTRNPECALNNEFQCGSGECIAWINLCDGLPHCKDGSDENVKCACGPDQWKCTSGQCIPAKARCDQKYDCRDSSDEMVCPDCAGFQCDTGMCLWDGNDGKCNGVFDCPDLSDEKGCPPGRRTMLCANSVRVQQSQWCDGLDDCGDNSDEVNCTAACSRIQFPCPDGRCILRHWVCDGYKDCLDGADESECASCLPSQFMCHNYRCLPETSVCDGIWDCKTGEDELHCFSAEKGSQGVLWARYKGKDRAVCADVWSTDIGVQICSDLNQLQLWDWMKSLPAPTTTRFVSFNSTSGTAYTTDLVPRNNCSSGRVINIACYEQACGERKVPFMQSFVAGGQVVSPGKWPWMVSLLHLGRFICGGSLINSTWVVTAAHCILNAFGTDFNWISTPYYFDVVLGSTHVLGQSSVGTPYQIRVKKIVMHPQMNMSDFGLVDWDVALLELSVPTPLTHYIQPLCLPHQGQSIPLTSHCYMAGWGLMNYKQTITPLELRDSRMQVWSDGRCARGKVLDEKAVNINSTLCAGFSYGIPAACQGDSGGPLMCLSPSGRWMLTGVLSRGSLPCGLSQPSRRTNRFVRVPNAVQWIRQEMGKS